MSTLSPYSDVPASIVCGDSLSFLVRLDDFPAPIWSLQFVIQTPTPKVIGSIAEGTAHRVAADSAGTSGIKFGRSGYTFVFTSGGSRKTIPGGYILVLPDPTAELTPTFAMAALAKVEAALLKLSGNTNASVDIDGQTYTKRNFGELANYRDRLIATVESELTAIGRPVSRGAQKTIHTRFV